MTYARDERRPPAVSENTPTEREAIARAKFAAEQLDKGLQDPRAADQAMRYGAANLRALASILALRGEAEPVVSKLIADLRFLYFEALEEAEYSLSPASVKEAERITRGLLDLYARPSPPTVAPEVVGWQPIETAPKDGSSFLAYDGDSGGAMFRARWEVDGYFSAACAQPVVVTPEPTHWMPLPEPPALQAVEGVEP